MDTKKLAVVFPGMGYHSDKPLLYYSKKLAKQMGYEVVEVSYDFEVVSKNIVNDKGAKLDAFKHAVSEAEKILADTDFSRLNNVLFIGKSIGTTVAAYFDKEHHINARHIVFTPVPETFTHLRKKCGIVFHGTADPWCETHLAEEKCRELELDLVKVEGTNHSLESGDIITDLGRMPGIMDRVKEVM